MCNIIGLIWTDLADDIVYTVYCTFYIYIYSRMNVFKNR